MFVSEGKIDPDRRVEKRLNNNKSRTLISSHTGTYHNGQMMYRTSLKNGSLQGGWESWYFNGGKRDSGKIRSNIPDGEWKIWYPNGQVKFIIHFNSLKFHSISSELDRQPKHKLYRISSMPREQGMVHLQSPFLSAHPVGNKKMQKFYFTLEDYRQSLFKEPTHYSTPFLHCLLHGEYIAYFENGQIKEQGIYINGLKDGVWEESNPEGWISRGTYYHGKKVGEWRTYDNNGRPTEFIQYNHQGKFLSSYEFNK